MEYRDLYDSKRNLLGKTIKKGDKVPEGTYILVVLAFIQNSKNEFLIQYTSKEKGSLFSSTGGHAKTGEDSVAAILTETNEELGINFDRNDLKLFYSGIGKKRIFDLYYIEKDLDINKMVLQKEEVSYVEWMTVDKILDLIDNNLFQKSHAEMFKICLEYLEKKEALV